MVNCFHCGDDCQEALIIHLDKSFCCHGCKTVYDIFQENDLGYYYDLEKAPGVTPNEILGKYDFLDNSSIVDKLLDFNEEDTQIISFLIPSIHCSSCIWVLENLNRLNIGVKSSQVNFPKKTVRVTLDTHNISVKELVCLLSRIGYEPHISLDDAQKKSIKHNRSLIYKLGFAGFAFGNVMFLSFPDYLNITTNNVGESEFWLEQFKPLFSWLMFVFSLPVVFYSGWDYFILAYKGLRSKILNIDLPIAIGIAVLFIRSSLDIIFGWGSGFFDSLTGLIFFLLLGRFFQQKTYAFLSFERDYKSYFPIAVTRLLKDVTNKQIEEQTEVYEIIKGDKLLIRNNEIIPVDAILLKGDAFIDYSFVTGEAQCVSKQSGDKLFAGGKQQGGIIEIEVLKPVEQSYLTQLWSNAIFNKEQKSVFYTLINRISKRFTLTVLFIACVATIYWLWYDPSKAFNVFTAVLIVACPCAIALASPFTLGNLLRIFGRHKFYLKDSGIIEQMASIDTIVFDKTGTLTINKQNHITYEGIELLKEEEALLASSLRASNHPLSRALYDILDKNNIKTLDAFEEKVGQGISASSENQNIKIGAYSFVNQNGIAINQLAKTAVHISSNQNYRGCYVFHHDYREGVAEIFKVFSCNKELVVLSGDNAGEQERLKAILPNDTILIFNQKPEDKLNFIKQLQEKGKNVMMVGDGLNDSGALKQSDVGIVISENINVFSPACDGILDASKFKEMASFLELSQKGVKIIKWAFLLSLCYNVIGVLFAVTGHLKPVIAAILMPLSSISIVLFTTVSTYLMSNKLRTNTNNKN